VGSDLVARIGGDELLVVLTGLEGIEMAIPIAEKLRQLAHEPVAIPSGEAHLSMSVGVAMVMPGESLEHLITRADAGMYTAKQQGGNRVVVITAEA